MANTEKVIQVVTPAVYNPFDEPYRYKVAWGGRAAARSWTIARKLLRRGMKQKLLILCTRELQKSIKQSVLKLLANQIEILHMGQFYHVDTSKIVGINGTQFIFDGIKYNTDEIKSLEGVDIAWIEEAHALSEDSWDVIDPTIRKENSQIWLSFNTRFKFDHVYQTFCTGNPPPDSLVLKTSYRDNHDAKGNTFLSDVLIKQMEALKERDYEKYLHVWEGELKLLAEGAVYGEQIKRARREERILDFPITNAPVSTFWDLGKNNQTAIWFMQKVAGQYRMIDYYESRLKEIPHYCKVVKGQALVTDDPRERCKITEAVNLRRQGYNYDMHYMPHDIETNVLGMERTRKAQFTSGGVSPMTAVPQISSVEEGIEQGRDIFPEVAFHKTNCERGIECLANYRYNYNEDKDSYTMNPHHDWASNGADAFRQMPQGYTVEKEKVDKRGKARRKNKGSWMS